MRTTVVIDDSLEGKLRPLAGKKGLSDFVNRCLWEHFEREERARRMAKLEEAYDRASKKAGKAGAAAGFDTLDVEGWPEW